MELVDFLRARLDEDAELAAPGESWAAFDESPHGTRRVDVDHSIERVVAVTRAWRGEHIARHDPARVLAEVKAKRALLDRFDAQHWHGPAAPTSPDPRDHVEETGACRTCITARVLARVYRDHPDFDPAWMED